MRKSKHPITNELITSLIEKKLLSHNSCITAWYKKSSDSGYIINQEDFALVSAWKQEGSDTKMKVRNESTELVITYQNIIYIDGMYPVDFAKAYDLKPDGSKKPAGIRRGRPPKHIIKEFF